MDDYDSVALEKAEAEYLLSRAEVLKKVPGNPYNVVTISNGKNISFLVATNPSPMNCRICGIDINNPVIPKNILAEFKKAGVNVCIPIIGKPANIKEKSERIGAKPLRGWSHGQFVADINLIPDIPVDHQTRNLKIKDMEEFVKIHSKEFGTLKTAQVMALDMFKGLLKTRRAEAYAVDIDGKPAAIGLTYYAKNNIAYLATAATSKYARKNGAHKALIAQRIKAARTRGSRQICSTALLNSQSRRNLESAGLSLAHVQTIITF